MNSIKYNYFITLLTLLLLSYILAINVYSNGFCMRCCKLHAQCSFFKKHVMNIAIVYSKYLRIIRSLRLRLRISSSSASEVSPSDDDDSSLESKSNSTRRRIAILCKTAHAMRTLQHFAWLNRRFPPCRHENRLLRIPFKRSI